MMQDNKNLILAFVISIGILLAFDFFLMRPARVAEEARLAQQSETAGELTERPALAPGDDLPAPPEATQPMTREAALEQSPRIVIDTPRLKGSIALRGGRIDDLTMTEYRTSVDKSAPPVTLLSPAGVPGAYFAEFGWAVAQGSGITAPSNDTRWTADNAVLAPGRPVTLRWESPEGVVFTRRYEIDEYYMFTITDRVENPGEGTIALAPYALVSRHGLPQTEGMFISHEGAIAVFGEQLVETKYGDLQDDGRISQRGVGGWIGFTDKYWLTALIPGQDEEFEGRFTHRMAGGDDRFQADYRLGVRRVAPGGAAEVTSHFFAGAKVVKLLDTYEEKLGISRFDRGIDWGWFYWITKPIFYLLHFFHGLLGNFGLAILLLTVCIKALFYPLANKSYVAMSKMKKLQPKMKQLQERYKDDKARLQQEMMNLYRTEKVNPVSGCLPIFVQIPVFFALYKVLYVTIEMRHAPFFGWVKDLSAPDPLTVVNLFGLIPWDPPQMIAIGIWPLLMGLTMYLQQKLNPAPADPVQGKIMLMMPIIFTFILAPFPVGLVIYWTWNNVLSILQQWTIMKRMGVSTEG